MSFPVVQTTHYLLIWTITFAVYISRKNIVQKILTNNSLNDQKIIRYRQKIV